MQTCDELAAALLECLRDVTSLIEHAYSTALEQQDALTNSNAEAIASTTISQDEILRRIAQADERAAAVAMKIKDATGLKIDTADAETIEQTIGAPYGNMIAFELNRIPQIAKKVRDMNEINAQLISNGLDIITSCLRIAVREPEPTVYSRNASFSGLGSGILTLDSRV